MSPSPAAGYSGTPLTRKLGYREGSVVFEAEKENLAKFLVAARRKIRPGASIWVSWPKKSSRVPTTITEDTVRELDLPLGFVDIKVCAVNEVWSGLKLVIRKELR